MGVIATQDAGRAMRRDAKARRDALIAAAAACFADRGYRVPLEEVAARAGVGRGTLYRNFRDREALALAIFGAEIDRVDGIVARDLDFTGAMTELAMVGARGTALFARIAHELAADTDNLAAFDALGDRLAVALEPLADRARADGDVHDGVDGRLLGLALRMVGCLLRQLQDDITAEREFAEALALVIRGLRPVPAVGVTS